MCANDRQRIIDALRSGRYRQLKGREHDGADGYCVMGLVHHLGIEPFAPGEASAVALMNHFSPMTFDQIADKIEAGDFDVSDISPDFRLFLGQMPARPYAGPPCALRRDALRRDALRRDALRRDAAPGDDDDPDPPEPPLVPAVIYIIPRRPVLSGAVSRPRFFGAAGRQLVAA